MSTEITFQPGPQERFLKTPADIAIYGGAAGGGKTFSLLLEPLRHVNDPNFHAVFFRLTYPQIMSPGGLWDESKNLYPIAGGVGKISRKIYIFPSGATIRFAYMRADDNLLDWQGSQVSFFAFDQLEQFSQHHFEYLIFSRSRSNSKVESYVRATCNPNPNSFLVQLLSWWIDKKSGYPIQERSGIIRYFIKLDNKYTWADHPDDLIREYPDDIPKSLTFIAAKVTDNKIGLKKNPQYISSLKALPLIDRERLLNGNWNIKESAGLIFKRSYFQIVDAIPANVEYIRYWDRAATPFDELNPYKDPDWTVGLKVGRTKHSYYIIHMERFRGTSWEVEESIKNIAKIDGTDVQIGIEQDPGQAGKYEVNYYTYQLSGYDVRVNLVSKDKITRAKPVSAQAEAGNIKVFRGYWNEAFFNELEIFPDGKHDDIVDALSGAFHMLWTSDDEEPLEWESI